jgi:hypothetical protein
MMGSPNLPPGLPHRGYKVPRFMYPVPVDTTVPPPAPLETAPTQPVVRAPVVAQSGPQLPPWPLDRVIPQAVPMGTPRAVELPKVIQATVAEPQPAPVEEPQAETPPASVTKPKTPRKPKK